MKRKLNLIISIVFVLAIVSVIFSNNQVEATEKNYYYPNLDEMDEIWSKLPNEITVGVKETELDKAMELAKAQIIEQIGRDDLEIETEFQISGNPERIVLNFKYYYFNQNNEKDYTNRYIKLNFSNSTQRNEADQKVIDNIVKKTGTNFNAYLDREIKTDGTKGEFEGLSRFSWNDYILAVIKQDTGIVDNTISAVVAKLDKNDVYDNRYGYYTIYLYKNDVYYAKVWGYIYENLKITIPENIKETTEDYSNYAKPIIEKLYKNMNAYVDELDKQNYTIKYNAKLENWRSDSSTRYYYNVEKEYYKNNQLENTVSANDISLRIAKKNEYRAVTNAVLKEIEIKEIDQKSYLTGKLKISETIEGKEGGYSTGIKSVILNSGRGRLQEVHTFSTKMPVVKLRDNEAKEYVAQLEKGADGLYQFKIAVDTIGKKKEYKIVIETQDVNNRAPYKVAIAEKDNELEKVEGIKFSWNNKHIEPYPDEYGSKLNITILSGTELQLGDPSGDGIINTEDARMVIKYYLIGGNLTEDQKEAADVNKDGVINTTDARLIIKAYLIQNLMGEN